MFKAKQKNNSSALSSVRWFLLTLHAVGILAGRPSVLVHRPQSSCQEFPGCSKECNVIINMFTHQSSDFMSIRCVLQYANIGTVIAEQALRKLILILSIIYI